MLRCLHDAFANPLMLSPAGDPVKPQTTGQSVVNAPGIANTRERVLAGVRDFIPQRHSRLRWTVDAAGGRQTGWPVLLYAQQAGDAVVAYDLGRVKAPARLREGGAVPEHGLTGSPLRQSAPRQRQCQRRVPVPAYA